MNRYRNWVGALHWGQLLLLLPSLLCIGVAVGGGAILFTDDRDSSADFAVDKAVRELREFQEFVDLVREPPALPRRKSLEEIFEDSRPPDEARRLKADRWDTLVAGGASPELRAVENAQAEKERVKSLGTWVLGLGMFGWAFAWLTAFLSLWWWFGARAKPKGAP